MQTADMTLYGHSCEVNALSCLGDMLVSAADDKSVKIWSLKDGSCVHTLQAHTNYISCILVYDC